MSSCLKHFSVCLHGSPLTDACAMHASVIAICSSSAGISKHRRATARQKPAAPQRGHPATEECHFCFDFFVSKVENYQANGVIFKGNLRGDPSVAYDRIAARLKVLLCY